MEKGHTYNACHRIHLGINSLLHDEVNKLYRGVDAIIIHITNAGTGASPGPLSGNTGGRRFMQAEAQAHGSLQYGGQGGVQQSQGIIWDTIQKIR